MARLVARAGARAAGRAAQRLAQGAGELALDWESAYALRFSGLTPNQRMFLSPRASDFRRTTGASRTFPPATREDRLLRWDFANYLPEYVLRKADLATMAHGLELRAPLLDHRFVEAVLALPPASRFTRPPKRFLARLAPELEKLGAFTAQEARLQPTARRLAQGRPARSTCSTRGFARAADRGQVDAARAQAMVDAYANTSSLAEQILSLVILEESLRQLAALAADG
jgi:asparagine synthase (glutamine-hydrolysing)